MTILAAMSTKELWSKLCDLLIQRMALDTTKEEWEKLTEQTNKLDAEKIADSLEKRLLSKKWEQSNFTFY